MNLIYPTETAPAHFRPLRVLIACETSGVIRNAFRNLGHMAWSCDLLPSQDASNFHLQCDLFEVLGQQWDIVGFHPDCTYLAGSGIHWNNRGRGWEKTYAALELVRTLLSSTLCSYLENPRGLISSHIRKPDQYVQPYEFGDDASKKTGLWLNQLSPLVPVPGDRVPGRLVEFPAGSGKLVERWSNQTDSGQNNLPDSKGRWQRRSNSYPGLASRLASQFSLQVTSRLQNSLKLCS